MTTQNKPLNKEEKELTKPEDETVVIKKSQLDALVARLDRVEKVANKGRLANFDKDNAGEQTTVIRVREMNGKIIKSWRTTADTVERDPITKRLTEDQRLEVTYFDDSVEEINIATFTKRYKHVPCTLVEATMMIKQADKEKYGIQRFKLEMPDGEEITIGSTFVN